MGVLNFLPVQKELGEPQKKRGLRNSQNHHYKIQSMVRVGILTDPMCFKSMSLWCKSFPLINQDTSKNAETRIQLRLVEADIHINHHPTCVDTGLWRTTKSSTSCRRKRNGWNLYFPTGCWFTQPKGWISGKAGWWMLVLQTLSRKM